MIEVILVKHFSSNTALTPLQKRPFQLAKMPKKYAILTLIFDKFFGGIAADLHTGNGLRRPSSDPTPEGAPRLSSA